MYNIITATIEMVKNPVLNIKEYTNTHNRANSMGESLEEYIKNLFAQVGNNTTESDVMIKNPDNPAQLKEAKLITFFVGPREKNT